MCLEVMLTKWLGWLAFVCYDRFLGPESVQKLRRMRSVSSWFYKSRLGAGQKHLHWCHVIEKSHLHSVDWVDPLEPNEEYKWLLENMVPQCTPFHPLLFFNRNFPKKTNGHLGQQIFRLRDTQTSSKFVTDDIKLTIWGYNIFSDTSKYHQSWL